MDGCVAVVDAEAEAVAVAVGEAEAVAVAAGDISPDETHLRRLNMINRFFKKSSHKYVYTDVFGTLDENLTKRGSV